MENVPLSRLRSGSCPKWIGEEDQIQYKNKQIVFSLQRMLQKQSC